MFVLFLTRIIDYFNQKIEELKIEFPEHEFIIPSNRTEAQKYISEASILVTGHLEKEQIINAKKLEYIIVPWAGINGLPLDVIREMGVKVCNNHGNGRIVAERAVALALSLLGRVVEFHNDLSKGIWHGYEAGSKIQDFWFSLQGKKVSILGLGTIGRNIAKLLSGFDCQIMGYKRLLEPVEYVHYVTNDIDEAVEFGHVIFLSLPLTKSTYGIISKERLYTMNGKFLVNVGRGQLIDEEGLYLALKDGVLAGAAIDTWYLYPSSEFSAQLPSRFPIHSFKNVVCSPHVGGFTLEGQKGRIDETIETIRDILSSKTPKNIVDLDLEY